MRTTSDDAPTISAEVEELEYSEEDYIINEDVWVMLTRDGWFKRQKSYTDLSTIRVRDNDEVGWVLPGPHSRDGDVLHQSGPLLHHAHR